MFPEILINQNIQAFFEFIYDRQAVWHKRTFLKEPAPWTDDKILQNFRFCNVYRELDGGTLAITKYLKQPLAPRQKLFNIIAYRFFNRRDTIDNLFGGLLNPDNFDFKFLEQRFDTQKADGNIFSNAYLITAHAYDSSYRPHDKHIQILLMLDTLRSKLDSLLEQLQHSPSQSGVEILTRNIPFELSPGIWTVKKVPKIAIAIFGIIFYTYHIERTRHEETNIYGRRTFGT